MFNFFHHGVGWIAGVLAFTTIGLGMKLDMFALDAWVLWVFIAYIILYYVYLLGSKIIGKIFLKPVSLGIFTTILFGLFMTIWVKIIMF